MLFIFYLNFVIYLLFVFLLLTLFLIVNMVLIAQKPDWQWANRTGGTNSDELKAITIDEVGNSFRHFLSIKNIFTLK